MRESDQGSKLDLSNYIINGVTCLFWTTFCILFLYSIWSATLFSSSWEILSLRNIDDNAMQFSISQMHNAVMQLDFKSFLSKYDYAYGWIFWFIYSAATFPIRLLQVVTHFSAITPLIIVGNRLTSVFLGFSAILIVRKTIGELVPKKKSENYLKGQLIKQILPMLIMLDPNFGYWAQRVQPNMFVLFTFSVVTYYLLKLTKKEVFSTRKLRNAKIAIPIILALIVAAKPVSVLLIFGLMPLLYANRHIWFSKKGRFGSFVSLIKYGFLFILSFVFFSCPAIIFYPWSTLKTLIRTFIYFSVTTTSTYSNPSKIIERLINGYLSPVIWISLLVMLIIYMTKAVKSKELNPIIFNIIPILIAGLLLSIHGPKYPPLVASYTFPSLILVQVFIGGLLLLYSNRITYGILILILSIGYCQFYTSLNDSNKMSISTYFRDYYDRNTHVKIKQIAEIRNIIALDSDPLILQSFKVPTVYSPIYSNVNVLYVFDNWADYKSIENIDWIVITREEFANAKIQISIFQSQAEPKNFIKFGNRNCKIREALEENIIIKCE